MGRDGDLACGKLSHRESDEKGAAGDKGTEGHLIAEAHVNANELEPIHACAWVSPNGGRHLGSERASPLHGETKETALATRKDDPIESAGPRAGSDGGVRGTARRGAPAEDAVRQPEEAYRSGFGVVKRQVHRSPGRGCKPVGQGRGVSLEDVPVTYEARVLVVRWLGKQKSVVRIVFAVRGESQDGP